MRPLRKVRERAVWAVLTVVITGCGGGKSAGPGSGGSGGAPHNGGSGGGSGGAALVPDYDLADPAPPSVIYDGKVVISPSALLFVKAGETAQLSAAAFDAAGAPVTGPVTWTSSRPEQVTVDASGLVASVAALGSAQITAKIGARVSAPILVSIVAAYPGTQLVTDAQIVSGPALVDPAAPIAPGVRVTATISGVSPLQPGTMLIAKEGKPLGGRVVSATAAGDAQTVVVELVPLLDLFQKMQIQTDTAVDEAALVAAEHAAQPLPSSVTDDPGYAFTQSALITRIGPFVCELTAGNTGLLTIEANARIVPSLHLITEFTKDAEGDWARIHVEMKGSVSATGRVTAKVSPGGQIEGSCSAVLYELPVPIGGALSLFLSAEVPVGIAGKFKAQVTAGNIQLGLEVTSTGHTDEGFEYTSAGGFRDIHDQGIDFHMKPKYSFPLTMLPVTSKLEAALGGFTGIDFRLFTERASLLRALFLGKAAGDFALVDTQLDDTAYASKYALTPVIEVGPGNTVANALRWFGGLLRVRPAISIELTELAAKSPAGQLTTPTRSVPARGTVDMTVRLDPTTLKFVGVDNVKEVRIYATRPAVLTKHLETTLPASPGQLEFKWTWHPQPADVGLSKFWAVVVTTLGPGIELELADNTTLPITVAEAGVGTFTYTLDETTSCSNQLSAEGVSSTATYSLTVHCQGMGSLKITGSKGGLNEVGPGMSTCTFQELSTHTTSVGGCTTTTTTEKLASGSGTGYVAGPGGIHIEDDSYVLEIQTGGSVGIPYMFTEYQEKTGTICDKPKTVVSTNMGDSVSVQWADGRIELAAMPLDVNQPGVFRGSTTVMGNEKVPCSGDVGLFPTAPTMSQSATATVTWDLTR